MKRNTYSNEVITRYLVGALASDETERLDELSLTDDEFAERLQSVENDLVDEYVRGELQGNLLERFESSYLASPTNREKVKFAESLQRTVDRRAGAEGAKNAEQSVTHDSAVSRGYRSSWWKGTFALPKTVLWPAMAVTAFLLIASSWLLVQDLRLRQLRDRARAANDVLALQSEKQQAQLGENQIALAEKQREIDELRRTLERSGQSSETEEPNVIPVVLEPQTRSISTIKTVSIPAEADFVAFQLELEGDDPADYQAILKSLPGQQTVWKRSGIRAQRRERVKLLVVTLRTRVLASRNYILEVADPRNAGSVLSSYTFKIVRE